MRKNNSSERDNFIRVGVLVAILLIFITVFLYQGYNAARYQIYFENTYRITKPFSEEVSKVNRAVAVFKGDTKSARRIQSDIKRAESIAAKAEVQIQEIKPPHKLTGYHKRLLRLLTLSRQFLRDLSSFFSYLSERDKHLNDFSTDIDAFVNASQNAPDDITLLRAIETLKTQTFKTRTSLSQNKSPGLQIYSNEVLDSYLRDVDSTLVKLEVAIADKNSGAIQVSAENLRIVLGRDWASSLIAADTSSIETLKARQEEIQQLQQMLNRQQATH